MYTKDTHDKFRNAHYRCEKMKGPQNCKHKECSKGSMMRVFTKFHSRVHQLIHDKTFSQKKWSRSTEATLCYICSKCAWAIDFNTVGWPDPKFILSDTTSFAIWLVPDQLVDKVRRLKEFNFQKVKKMTENEREEYRCIGCGQWVWLKYEMRERKPDDQSDGGYEPVVTQLPGSKEPSGWKLKYWPGIVKLWIEERSNYAGYYCRHCKVAYMLNVYPTWKEVAKQEYGLYKIIPYTPICS